MDVKFVQQSRQPLDLIVGGEGDRVIVELDIRHNATVRAGDQFYAQGDGFITILRVESFAYARQHDNESERYVNGMRQGVVGEPSTDSARERFQKKLAVMQIEGQLFADGRRSRGVLMLPERLTPVRPLDDDTLERFTVSQKGELILGLLRSSRAVLDRPARFDHTLAGGRMVILGKPGRGKSQLARALVSQVMALSAVEQVDSGAGPVGFLVLDRSGEYIRETRSQDGYRIQGLTHHPLAPAQLVVVSNDTAFARLADERKIHAALRLQFNIQDIRPIDLVDFYGGFSPAQRDLLRDYAYMGDLYARLLKELPGGVIDRRNWYRDFPGLFRLNASGTKRLEKFRAENAGEDLTADQMAELSAYLSGKKTAVLERIILAIRRFAAQPLFGGQQRGAEILRVRSSVDDILAHLARGKTVVVDLRGVRDDDYTLIGALFARRLLDENIRRGDEEHLRVAMLLEESHNILSAQELNKGENGRGSAFVEYAREGRKFKLGLVLVTQQPDARSIAPEVAHTLDTIVAFQMPPENIRHLTTIRSVFRSHVYTLENARVFEGVAVTEDGVLAFQAVPVTEAYMKACARLDLEGYLKSLAPPREQSATGEGKAARQPTEEERRAALRQERRRRFLEAIRETAQMWEQEKP